MVVHSISGGTFYLRALAEASAIVQRAYKPDCFIGISSGLLVAIVSAVHGVDKMLEHAHSVDLLKAVPVRPFNTKGKPTLRAMFRFATNRNIVVQDTKPIISKIITKEDFCSYIYDEKAANVYTTLYNINSKKIESFNLKNCVSYNQFLRIIDAGCAAQGLVKPVQIGNNWYSEGGAKDHNAGHRFLQDLHPDLYISLYSRPADWQRKEGQVKGAIPQLFDMIACDNQEKSINDEQREQHLCEQLNIQAIWGYCDRTLSHPYSTDEKEIQAAIKSAKQSINNNLHF